jgi:hypothetical protein
MRPQRLYCYNIIAELEKGPRTLRDLKSALGDVSYGALAVALNRLWALPDERGRETRSSI